MFTPSELQNFRCLYEENGYVVVPSLIPAQLFPRLSQAADKVTDLARTHRWSQVRMVGKQFPPWTEGDDVWGVQNIVHPDLAKLASSQDQDEELVEGVGGGIEVFREWYGSEEMLRVSAALMGCEREDMQFELFNLLVNPLEKDYALKWHRDDIKPNVSASEEAERLKIDHHGIQWNTALSDDDCLSAVPRSHRRVRTEEERKAESHGGEMPGGVVVRLNRGETVFYNNNILHVGKYNPKVKRRTLHGCYGCPPPGDTTRARNILQHDLAYTRDPGFRETLPEALRPMLDRLNGMQRQIEVEGKEIGYSHDD